MEKARIIKIISNRYEVTTMQGKRVLCIAMGKLRQTQAPMVGDFVNIEQFANQCGIQEILPRKNQLVRPSIANVDQAIIVMSAKDPDFSTTLIDRLIFSIAYAKIKPLLLVSKLDLLADKQYVYAKIEEYQKAGYQVFTSNNKDADEDFINILQEKVSVLCGQSGVGKSTLLNRMDPSFKLRTQAISKALGRGKHTTRHTELHAIKKGLIADTPGFSSMEFSHMDITNLASCIPDFQPYVGECRFRDCKHLKEPGCKIHQMVAEGKIAQNRYNHYEEVVKFIEESKVRY